MKQLRFNALVLETTDRCNAKCDMCYQAAGPKGSDIRGDGRLPLSVIQRVIGEAAELPELEGDRVHVSGGEGFLNFDEMVSTFKFASECGFKHIGATTNSFWAVNDKIAEQKCSTLLKSGVNYLEVSMDYWHLPYVKLYKVRNLIRAANKTGIRIMLRTLSSHSHKMHELLSEFTDEELLHIQIANSTVAPVGRGKETIPLSEAYTSKNLNGCCENLLNLTIAPNGNVYPCCAGADMTNSLSVGNVHEDSLSQAVLSMRTDYMIRVVIHKGADHIEKILKQLGYEDFLLNSYSSICHFCWHVFSNDILATALREYFANEQFEILQQIVNSINTENEEELLIS